MLPLGAIIPLAGLGGAALGMPVGQIFDAPRKWAWKNLLGLSSDSGEEVVRDWMTRAGLMPHNAQMGGPAAGSAAWSAINEAAGEDQKPLSRDGQMTAGDAFEQATAPSPLTQALGMGLEMALDPFTILGSLAGGTAGAKLYQNLAGKAARSPLQQAMGHLDELEGMVGRHMPRQVGNLTIAPTSMTSSTYIPEILDELPDVMKLGKAGKTYSRVSPEASELTQRLGLGSPVGEGLNVMQPPSFLEGRGGKMFLGKNAPTHMQYEDVLTGMPDVNPDQTFASLLGTQDASAVRDALPWARARDFSGRGLKDILSSDAAMSGQHVVDMPMGAVPGQISNLRGALAGRLASVERDLSGRSPLGATADLGRELGKLWYRNHPEMPPGFLETL